MPPGPVALRRFVEVVALWRIGHVAAVDVVAAAVDLVVADLGGSAVGELAGVPRAAAVVDVPELVGPACAELGLPVVGRQSPWSYQIAAAAMCARLLRDELTPRQVTRWVHASFGHSGPADVERLSELDDHYDTLDYTATGSTAIDAEVNEVAKRLARTLDVLLLPASSLQSSAGRIGSSLETRIADS